MGRSKETYGKRAKEKKKMEHKAAKEERKEMRKAYSNKGKGLDSMLAYVDENGFLTSQPVDYKKEHPVNEIHEKTTIQQHKN